MMNNLRRRHQLSEQRALARRKLACFHLNQPSAFLLDPNFPECEVAHSGGVENCVYTRWAMRFQTRFQFHARAENFHRFGEAHAAISRLFSDEESDSVTAGRKKGGQLTAELAG